MKLQQLLNQIKFQVNTNLYYIVKDEEYQTLLNFGLEPNETTSQYFVEHDLILTYYPDENTVVFRKKYDEFTSGLFNSSSVGLCKTCWYPYKEHPQHPSEHPLAKNIFISCTGSLIILDI